MSLLQRTLATVLGERVEAPPDLPEARLPEGVTLRRGALIPRIGGLLIRSRLPAAAVTLRKTVILSPSATLTPELLEHELTHVRQWRADWLFPLRYTLATLRHGYHENPYEVEAREAARGARGEAVRGGGEAAPTPPP